MKNLSDHQQKLTGATICSPSPLSLTYNLNNMLYKIVKCQALILKSTKNSRAFKSIEKKKSLCSCWESAMPTCKCWASPVGERKRNPPNLTKYFSIPMATASLGSGPPETLSKACVTWKTRSVSSCHKQHTGWGIRVFVSARRAPSEGISAKLKLGEILFIFKQNNSSERDHKSRGSFMVWDPNGMTHIDDWRGVRMGCDGEGRRKER